MEIANGVPVSPTSNINTESGSDSRTESEEGAKERNISAVVDATKHLESRVLFRLKLAVSILALAIVGLVVALIVVAVNDQQSSVIPVSLKFSTSRTQKKFLMFHLLPMSKIS